ncbi:MAG: hypothetical protein DWH79_01020 [Planctomycetota bacterium]|nr:MAG: hypothetical protein DWH79_01020 [Planctomycetota bacterium]
MFRFTHVSSLILAASTLVASASSEATPIHYDITNATSVQNSWSLSGYIEVAATGNVTSLSSWNFTATKANNATVTFDSTSGSQSLQASIGSAYLNATSSALYVPSRVSLAFNGGDPNFVSLEWSNGYYNISLYQARESAGTYNDLWVSSSYPVTDSNGWEIGSVQSNPVPEIDPATGSSALSLVAGVLAMIEQRRRRATLVA